MKKFFSLIIAFSLFNFVFAERPMVSNIHATPGRGDKINVFWTLPENAEPEISELMIYRDTVPISSIEQIKGSQPVAILPGDFTGYTDTVPDFSDYFYAVIGVTTEPYDLIMLSINSTIKGVHIVVAIDDEGKEKEVAEKLYANGTSRELPLPYLDVVEGLNKDKELISDDVVNIAKMFALPSSKRYRKLAPYYFEEDLISPDTGDDYLLFDILKNQFVLKNYDNSVKLLLRLISANISDSTKSRAIFYLGESYYFLEQYEDAIKTFVRVENDFPVVSKKWLDSSLDLIK